MLQWWAGFLEPGSSESRRHGDSRRRLGVRLRPSLLLVLVIALLLGCSPGRVATSRPTVAELPLTATVGPAGAVLSFHAGTLTVPPGAVPGPTTVHIRAADKVPSPPSGDVMHPLPGSVMIDFNGAQPVAPLTFSLSVSPPAGIPPEALMLATASDNDATLHLLGGRYDATGHRLEAQLQHLSFIVPVWLDAQAFLRGLATWVVDDVFKQRARRPDCVAQSVALPDGSTVDIAPGGWHTGSDPEIWACLALADDSNTVRLDVTDNRATGFTYTLAA